MATRLLMNQYKDIQKDPPNGISIGLMNDDRLDVWEVLVMGSPGLTGSLYEEGMFKAKLEFPSDFPNNPPKMTFVTSIMHPNIYPDGKVCISILHPPGTDAFNAGESADERWRPILGVEGILVSVVSMLMDPQPNLDSPANIDAAKLFRENPKQYRREVRRLARRSMEECY